MNIYGPSAATGISGVAYFGTFYDMSATSLMYLLLAVFTLIGAAAALWRVTPKFRRKG
ncbi:MAG: hypothetical protein KDA17_06590 [Candidatus Saccharibacteria bacterium]|nr:hypothetical protein [Candidatus Saccharibacteria bacterium]MCA9340555.1 hypothetical protein [Candidatus Saccharibacteria bacterium]